MSDTTGQRKSGPARRADIVGAARAVFLAEGYADVGLTDVAAAGEVSRGLVYRHFPRGRSELFLAVTEDLLGELQERLRYAAKQRLPVIACEGAPTPTGGSAPRYRSIRTCMPSTPLTSTHCWRAV